MAKITTNELRKRLSVFAHQWAGASSEKADEKLFPRNAFSSSICLRVGTNSNNSAISTSKD